MQQETKPLEFPSHRSEVQKTVSQTKNAEKVGLTESQTTTLRK